MDELDPNKRRQLNLHIVKGQLFNPKEETTGMRFNTSRSPAKARRIPASEGLSMRSAG